MRSSLPAMRGCAPLLLGQQYNGPGVAPQMLSSPPALRGSVPPRLRQAQRLFDRPLTLLEPPCAELKPSRPSVNQWNFDRGSVDPGNIDREAFDQGSKFEPSVTTAFGTWRQSPGPLRPSPPVQPSIPNAPSVPSTAALLVALGSNGGGNAHAAGVAEKALNHGDIAAANTGKPMLPATPTQHMPTLRHTGPLTPDVSIGRVTWL